MSARKVITFGLVTMFCLPASPAFAQAPARTFAELKTVLKPGQRVIVIDAKDLRTAGKVVSIEEAQIEIKEGRRQYTFSRDAVRRIEKDDSNTDGMLIGAAVGMLLGILVAKHPSSTSEGAEAALGVGITVLGVELGDRIDSNTHRALYVAPATAAPAAPGAAPSVGLPTLIPGGGQASGQSIALSFLTPGARVRVSATSVSIASQGVVVKDEKPSLRLAGAVEAVDAEHVMIATDRSLMKIPVRTISAVDVSVGKKRNTLWGLAVGLGLGLVTGLAASVDADNCGSMSTNFCSRGAAIGQASLFFAGLGAAIGTFVKTDRWERRFPQPAIR